MKNSLFHSLLPRWAFLLVAIVMLGGLPTITMAQELAVVIDGVPKATIVHNSAGGRITALAVKELNDHIEQITGVRLPSVAASKWDKNDAGTFLIIGQGTALEELNFELGNLSPEGYRIVTLPAQRSVVLAGRDKGDPLVTRSQYRIDQEFGTLYAVYELLEHWGVRWLFPGPLGQIVPQRATLQVPVWDKDDAPAFRMRNHWLRAYASDGSTVGGADLRSDDKERRTLALEARLWALRNRSGNSLNLYFGGHHSPGWWDLWSESNPEFLGLYRGQRGIRRSPPTLKPDQLRLRSKICAGNPQAALAVAELAKEAFRKSPGLRSYSICEQDGSPGFCECPLCMALDVPQEGDVTAHLTDRYVVFWNRVAEEVATEFPDRNLGVYLYSFYNELPRRETRLHPMIRAIFVANEEVEPESLKRRINGWSRITPNPLALYTHPMYGGWSVQDFSGAGLPALNLANIHEGIGFLHNHGVVGIIGDAGHFGFETVGSHGILSYAFGRWLWNPALTPAEILSDFAQHAFGSAADTMLAYFTTIEERQNSTPRADGRKAWLEHHLKVFTPEFTAHLETLLVQALKEAATEQERQRINIFCHNLKYTVAELQLERSWRRFVGEETTIESVAAAYRECEAVYEKLPPETRPRKPLFRQSDAAKGLQIEKHQALKVLPHDNWQMRADPYDVGLRQGWSLAQKGDGEWRSLTSFAYDLQGLWGSDTRVWYRTKFTLPTGARRELLRLGFRVENSSAEIFLNGKKIGHQLMGEQSYREPELGGAGELVPDSGERQAFYLYNIARHTHTEAENQLAVRVWGYTDRGVFCQPAWLLQEIEER